MKKFILTLLTSLLLMIVNCNYKTKIHIIHPWPNGKIPYKFIGKIDIHDRLVIINAMNQWEQICGIDFYECNTSVNSKVYRIIKLHYSRNYSSSTVGYVKYAKLQYSKAYPVVILHELGHCLGFFHEHQRIDRDKYIIVYKNNIRAGALNAYQKEISLYPIFYKMFPYDIHSIMHYSSWDFNKKGKLTMTTKDGKPIKCPSFLSKIDKQKAVYLYGKPRHNERLGKSST